MAGKMSATSFKCDPDLKRIIEKKKDKTGKSQARIMNDALRKAFSREDINKKIEESIKLHHKSIYFVKALMNQQEYGEDYIKKTEKDFEEYYTKIISK